MLRSLICASSHPMSQLRDNLARSSLDEWLLNLYNEWSAIFTLFPFLCANIDCVYKCNENEFTPVRSVTWSNT